MNRRAWSANLWLGPLLLSVLLAGGCRTAPPLPPTDFSEPGWQVLQGQAVWQPGKKRPALAGEIVLATRTNGNFFVQFSKTPFPLATAQVKDGAWRIEFGSDRRVFTGRGAPPPRFLWFQLPQRVRGEGQHSGPKSSDWAQGLWRLENLQTGEWLEGMFFP